MAVVDEGRAKAQADLEFALAARFGKVPWASPELARAVHGYLFRALPAQGVLGLVVLFGPLGHAQDNDPGQAFAAQVTRMLSHDALQQAAWLQAMTDDEFQQGVRNAWARANPYQPVPQGAGYRHFLGEAFLAALRRLKEPLQP